VWASLDHFDGLKTLNVRFFPNSTATAPKNTDKIVHLYFNKGLADSAPKLIFTFSPTKQTKKTRLAANTAEMTL
jgi:hypothetical protein